jgi:endogenous inhibitor of DNA gyrase (YacG/DUF329 family)
MVTADDGQRTTQILGICPACDRPIPKPNLLIAYETADGWPRMFAECPSCGEPVHPE